MVDGVSSGIETVGNFTKKTNADLITGLAAALCAAGALETAGVACAPLAIASLATGLSRAAVEGGFVGDKSRNYCSFGLTAATSLGILKATRILNRRLWVEPYVLGRGDRRFLIGSTGVIGASFDYLAQEGYRPMCGSGATSQATSGK